MHIPFSAVVTEIEQDRIQQYSLFQAGALLSYREVVSLWKQDATFRVFFLQQLQKVPFAAFFWETPPITSSSFDRRFEFVLVNSKMLAQVRPEPTAFQNQFPHAKEGVAVFSNLGGDATLVVPSNESAGTNYPHLAAFVRSAQEAQAHTLWQRVGETIETTLSDRPLWVSTAGMGVYWLHVRLDSRPKYYRFRPYKDPTYS